MEWTSTDWPDWEDQGRGAEVELENGRIAVGELAVDDFFPDDNGGEVPIFIIRSNSGETHQFAGNKRWRFI